MDNEIRKNNASKLKFEVIKNAYQSQLLAIY